MTTQTRPHTVALDFDGTIYAGPWTQADEVTGLPNIGAIEWLRAELTRGHHIIVHTCRMTAPYDTCPFPVDGHRDPVVVMGVIQAWFVLHGLTQTQVERLEFWTRPGKPWAHEYLDDKAVRFDGTYPQREPT